MNISGSAWLRGVTVVPGFEHTLIVRSSGANVSAEVTSMGRVWSSAEADGSTPPTYPPAPESASTLARSGEPRPSPTLSFTPPDGESAVVDIGLRADEHSQENALVHSVVVRLARAQTTHVVRRTPEQLAAAEGMSVLMRIVDPDTALEELNLSVTGPHVVVSNGTTAAATSGGSSNSSSPGWLSNTKVKRPCERCGCR